VTSFAVFAFVRRRPDRDAGPWRTQVAPLLAGLLLGGIVVLGVTNFNVLITGELDAPTASMSITLPAILLAAGLLGVLVAAVLRRTAPERYALIGERTEVEAEEHLT
jgi:cytochrome bd-type quinol oxidase subunit 1